MDRGNGRGGEAGRFFGRWQRLFDRTASFAAIFVVVDIDKHPGLTSFYDGERQFHA